MQLDNGLEKQKSLFWFKICKYVLTFYQMSGLLILNLILKIHFMFKIYDTWYLYSKHKVRLTYNFSTVRVPISDGSNWLINIFILLEISDTGYVYLITYICWSISFFSAFLGNTKSAIWKFTYDWHH